ncbi:MAG: hypothetical protein AB1696_28400 [Planctomycetota bacterium]
MSGAEGGQYGVIGWLAKRPMVAKGAGAAGATFVGTGMLPKFAVPALSKLFGIPPRTGGPNPLKSWLTFFRNVAAAKGWRIEPSLTKAAHKYRSMARELKSGKGARGLLYIDLATHAGYGWAQSRCDAMCRESTMYNDEEAVGTHWLFDP